jgi:hypothetical protein
VTVVSKQRSSEPEIAVVAVKIVTLCESLFVAGDSACSVLDQQQLCSVDSLAYYCSIILR